MSAEISRVIRSKEAARANYNRMSRWYDLFAGSEKRFAEIGLRRLNAKAGERALEIGCGSGHSLEALARAVGESGEVYGLDISEGMLQVAHARLARAGLAERVDLRRGDAASLPFETGSCDVLFMSFTLELFDTPEIPIVLSECRRVLRPGGRMGVVALAKEESLAVRLYEWFHARLPNLVDCRPIQARQTIAAAGFNILNSAVESMWGLAVEIVTAQVE